MAPQRRQLYIADRDRADDPLPDHERRRYPFAVPWLWTLWCAYDRGFCDLAGIASAIEWPERPFPRRPRKDLLVAAHRRHLCLFELSALFQTSAYPAGVSKRVLCPAGP